MHRFASTLDPSMAAALVAFAAFLCAVCTRLPGALSTIYWYSDFPEALRLGDAVFPAGPQGGMQLPLQSGVGPLWVSGFLHWLTGSDVAAMALGAVMALVAVGFMARAAALALDLRSTVFVAVLAVASPPVVAWQFLSPVAHSGALLLTAVMAWQVVRLAGRMRGATLISAVAVGLLAGVCTVSDPLALFAAGVPWLVAVLIAWEHPQVRLPAAATAGTAVVSAAAVLGAMQRAHVTVMLDGGTLSNAAGLLNAVAAGARGTDATAGRMLTGLWYGVGPLQLLEISGAVLLLAVALLSVWSLRAGDIDDARRLYVVFWMASAAAIVAAFCLSGKALTTAPIDTQGHYLSGVWFAIAALLPLGLLRRGLLGRATVAVAVGLVLASARGVLGMPAMLFNGPDYADGAALDATLMQLGIAHGYGGYWESYGIGWHTDGAITALPLQACTQPVAGAPLCRYAFAPHAWYQAQPGSVFVVVTRSACSGDDLCIDSAALARFGAPQRSIAVGNLVVDVFAHDVFAALPQATRV